MASTTPHSQTIFFVESRNLKWTSLLLHTSLVKLPRNRHHKFNPKTSTLNIKCFFTNTNNSDNNNKNGSNIRSFMIKQKSIQYLKNKENPMSQNLDFCVYSWENLCKVIRIALGGLQKPAVAAVLVGALLVLCNPNVAFAASGGRMGGRSFSSRPSSSSSSSSSGADMVPSMGGPSYSCSAASYFAPSPFLFGGGGGVGVAYVGPAVGVGSSFFYIIMGFTAFVLVSGFLSGRTEGGVVTATEKTSVLKLQVGLLGMAKSLQGDLNQIAETADTSSPEGLHHVLTETILALLRHPSYCISTYSSVDVKRSIEEGEKQFNQLSIEERGKFEEETLVNVNNVRRLASASQRGSGLSNEYIVITILVAAEGIHKLPTINSGRDLNNALQKLASIPPSRIMAVEVLWTPQNENDTLSERDLLKNYPLLQPL